MSFRFERCICVASLLCSVACGSQEEPPEDSPSMRQALVIDDSRAVRLVARRILERLEFTVFEAADIREAFEACALQTLDFLFLELHVQGSIEFLAYQRSRFSGPQPKVLACVVATDDPQLDGALRAGADDFILKPFDREMVEARLREIGLIEVEPEPVSIEI